MKYDFRCECGLTDEVEASIHNGPPIVVSCSFCGMPMQRIYGGFQVSIPGKQEDYVVKGVNVAGGAGRSDENQERVYAKLIQQEAKEARENKRSLSKHNRDMTCRKIGTIPREAFEARKLQHGKNYWWHDDVKSLVKRDGFLFDDIT